MENDDLFASWNWHKRMLCPKRWSRNLTKNMRQSSCSECWTAQRSKEYSNSKISGHPSKSSHWWPKKSTGPLPSREILPTATSSTVALYYQKKFKELERRPQLKVHDALGKGPQYSSYTYHVAHKHLLQGGSMPSWPLRATAITNTLYTHVYTHVHIHTHTVKT